jgi:dephospho-CoA kinase
MWVVGLTGGIGSGKSTVARQLADLGAGVVDTDEIAHALTASNGLAMARLEAAFGSSVIAADGSLNRAAVREQVFRAPSMRKQLEAILHPMIHDQARLRLRTLAPDHAYLILVVPLLVETGIWQREVNRVLVVDCDEAVQVLRVMQRSGLSESEVRDIMAAQATRAQRLAAADDVIDNSGPPEQLLPELIRLHEKYCNFSAQSGA